MHPKPEKCELVNLTTFERIKAQFNPMTLQRAVAVNWSRVTIPGLSHQPLHYSHTSNEQLRSVQFLMDSHAGQGYDVRNFEGFVMALTVPPEQVDGVTQAYPPRCLFVWPSVLSFEFVVTSVGSTYQLFYPAGGVRSMALNVGFERIADVRIYSGDKRAEVPLKANQVEDELVFIYGHEG